ncbi:universal stress protein [Limimaricola pyoseonensis]|uniref:Nucleotide-binding universal stress protein, UspA family n=1 Tax=Limimaricola pyoseonensis TaxID=521013 RepID=A0A1G7FZZ3_9RHOB|nr:universal stress protein [Limimaricola pyoseonensis]SDE81443.1 Nucleotide-binding universal stress protein, UspA family [Limimaricola pyoseonensis]
MFDTVLLPIDLSQETSWSAALPAALRLVEPEGVLHVVTVVPDYGLSIVGGYFDRGHEKKLLQDVGRKLAEWVEANLPDEVEVHPHVLHGRVYEEIISAANRLEAQAIVLASHDPALSDYLIGPNAARVVRHARQSVFVVRDYKGKARR